MNFNTDGFNDRSIYIHNSNDRNRLAKNGPSNIDNSFAQMRVEERKNMVETTNDDVKFFKEEVKGNRENFILMNNNMRNINTRGNQNNPLRNVMDRNRFKRF